MKKKKNTTNFRVEEKMDPIGLQHEIINAIQKARKHFVDSACFIQLMANDCLELHTAYEKFSDQCKFDETCFDQLARVCINLEFIADLTQDMEKRLTKSYHSLLSEIETDCRKRKAEEADVA